MSDEQSKIEYWQVHYKRASSALAAKTNEARQYAELLDEASERAARWIPVQPGNIGIFLTRNGKHMTSAEPVDEWKINKYGLKYWLYNTPPNPA